MAVTFFILDTETRFKYLQIFFEALSKKIKTSIICCILKFCGHTYKYGGNGASKGGNGAGIVFL